MKDLSIKMAGFGGQGILYIGKVITYAGFADNKEVSFISSYGAEMRGGSVDCTVCVSEKPVCSPVTNAPDVLVVMNQASFNKFADTVAPGGTLIVDDTLVEVNTDRTDITICKIPSTALADEHKMSANVIMLGYILKVTGVFDLAAIEKGLVKSTSARNQSRIPKNMEAIKIGYEF